MSWGFLQIKGYSCRNLHSTDFTWAESTWAASSWSKKLRQYFDSGKLIPLLGQGSYLVLPTTPPKCNIFPKFSSNKVNTCRVPVQPYKQLGFSCIFLGQNGIGTLFSWGDRHNQPPTCHQHAGVKREITSTPPTTWRLARGKNPYFVSCLVLWKSEVHPMNRHKL